MTMSTPLTSLKTADRETIARASQDRWGFCGVGLREDSGQSPQTTGVFIGSPVSTDRVRSDDPWLGVMLIASRDGLPRNHPLALGGLDSDTAGLAVAYVSASVSAIAIGKRLCRGLIHVLRGQVTGIESQSSVSSAVATPVSPSHSWLIRMGFRSMRYPLNRYRLDFAHTIQWYERHPLWGPWAAVTRPAPEVGLARSSFTDPPSDWSGDLLGRHT